MAATVLVSQLLNVLPSPAVAYGQSSSGGDPTAHSHFRVAETFYKEGRFVEAGAEFDKAYELSKKPQLLFNAYLAYRDAAMLDEAADRLRRYLDAGPEQDDLAFLRSRLDILETQIAERDAAQAKAAEQERLLREETARNDEKADEARRQAAIDEARGKRSQWIAIGIAGGGGALLIGGAVVGAIALARANEARLACDNDLCPFGFDVDAARSSVVGVALASDLLIGAGIAAATTGLIYWLVTRKKPNVEKPAPTAVGFCLPSGCSAAVSVRFQ